MKQADIQAMVRAELKKAQRSLAAQVGQGIPAKRLLPKGAVAGQTVVASVSEETGEITYSWSTPAGGGGAEVNDLTDTVTWANIPDANVPESAVTQHQAALSITESQISDLGSYLTSETSHADVVVDADIGVNVQAYSAVLAGTTASFTTAQETKLTGIEAGADVTDATNVAAAGALMNKADVEAVLTGEITSHTHPAGGGVAPYAHLTITSTQNMGGANGTVNYVDWDGTQLNVDTGFTHSTGTNPSRIQVDADGRYSLYWMVGITQGGSARTTFMSALRVNGTTVITRGRQRNYSRGSNYGDTSLGMTTEIDLVDGDYIEVNITVDDADSTYTSNCIPAECELIIRKIG